MQTVLIVLVLLAICVIGIHLLLKSMGQDGIEAAAPGSCKSGRCGVQTQSASEEAAVPVQYIRVDEIKRRA